MTVFMGISNEIVETLKERERGNCGLLLLKNISSNLFKNVKQRRFQLCLSPVPEDTLLKKRKKGREKQVCSNKDASEVRD